MKKEKQVKSYQRRTKSGKVVTVKAHTAKYDAAEKAKEAAKKKGAGKELEDKFGKKKMPDPNLSMNEYLDELKKGKSKRSDGEGASMVEHNGKQYFVNFKTGKVETSSGKPISSNGAIAKAVLSKHKENRVTPKDKKPMVQTTKSSAKPTSSGPAFTASEFKEWYHGTGSAADKKVAKALRAQLGRSGYRKFEDEAINNYSSRGHLSMFKRVGATQDSAPKSPDTRLASGAKPKAISGDAAKNKYEKFRKTATNDYLHKDYQISYKGNEGVKLYGDGSSKRPYRLEKATPAEIKEAKKLVKGEETFGTKLSKGKGSEKRVAKK